MTFLDDAGGYTPVPDKLVREYDYTTAYVWGKMWRYCQMASGKCTASHETIAKRAGMSRRTLISKLKRLIKDGYIEDLTPDLDNKPHTYCTKKGEEKITSTVQNLHTELDESAEIAQQIEPTMQNLHTDYAEFAQPTMQNLHSKKEDKETLKEISGKPPNGNHAGDLIDSKLKQEMVFKLSEICKINLRTASGKQKGQLGTAAESLIKIRAGPPQLDKFSAWWYASDWRGKQKQAPEPLQVCEEWGRFESSASEKTVRITAI